MGSDIGKSLAAELRLRVEGYNVKVPPLEWDALGSAMRVHEPASAIGMQFFQFLDGAGYEPEEIRTLARTLYAHVDYEETGDAP
jgi:hypothetical protein